MDPTLKFKVISTLKDSVGSFPPRMQTVAKYVIDHPADFGLDSIRETARKAGVSTYSLVRMAERLGFDSYVEFREPFRHALVSATRYEERPAWIADFARQGQAGQAVAEAALNSLSNAQETLRRQSPETLEQAAETMISANVSYVSAMRASYSMAHYFYYVGSMALPSLQLVPRNMGNAIDELMQVKPGDALLAITVSPYSRETLEACEFAQRRGAKLIHIADSDMAAPGLEPDFVLTASSGSTHHFACYSGVIAILEALLSLLTQLGGKSAADRIRSYEAIRAARNIYIPDMKGG